MVVSAFDFRATCFMTPPFIEVALRRTENPLCRAVAEKIKYPHPRSSNVADLLSASYGLIQFGSKAIGMHNPFNLVLVL